MATPSKPRAIVTPSIGLFAGLTNGFMLLFLQLFMAMALAPGLPFDKSDQGVVAEIRARYEHLNGWDSNHYASIAGDGYHLPPAVMEKIKAGAPEADWLPWLRPEDVHQDRANVAYFPAYPVAARFFAEQSGIPVGYALLVVAQFCTMLFWAYVILFLGVRGLSAGEGMEMSFLIALWPTTFYLVMGYSESLFMAALVGMLYWSERAIRRTEGRGFGLGSVAFWGIAGAHGFACSSSRLVGLPMAAYPALRALLPLVAGRGKIGARLGSLVGGAIASAMAVLGGLAFFQYCQEHFGAWDVYLRLQQLGWDNRPDYLAPFKPMSYLPRFFFEDTMDSISRLSVPVSLAVLAGVAIADFRENAEAASSRLALYLSAFGLLYISMAGKAHANMDSMSRYTFPVFTLTILAWAWSAGRAPARNFSLWLAVGLAMALGLEGWMAWMFLRGHWVA